LSPQFSRCSVSRPPFSPEDRGSCGARCESLRVTPILNEQSRQLGLHEGAALALCRVPDAPNFVLERQNAIRVRSMRTFDDEPARGTARRPVRFASAASRPVSAIGLRRSTRPPTVVLWGSHGLSNFTAPAAWQARFRPNASGEYADCRPTKGICSRWQPPVTTSTETVFRRATDADPRSGAGGGEGSCSGADT